MRKLVLGALRWLALLVTGAALAFDALVLAVGVPRLEGMRAFRVFVFYAVVGIVLAFIVRRTWRWRPARN